MKRPIYEIIAAQATAPGAGGAAASIAPGSGTTSLRTRSTTGRVNILQAWGFLQATGFTQAVWNSGHDQVRNFRTAVPLTNPFHQKPFSLDEAANPNEDITVTIGGSATAGDVESMCLLAEYDSLGGMEGAYITEPELRQRDSGTLTTVEMELTGTAAGWTGARALNAATALLKASRSYAVLGITTDTACAAVGLQGPLTGNYLIGCPGGTTQTEDQAQWFMRASALSGKPVIPVLRADDSAGTLLSFLQNENNIAPNVTLFLALLK